MAAANIGRVWRREYALKVLQNGSDELIAAVESGRAI